MNTDTLTPISSRSGGTTTGNACKRKLERFFLAVFILYIGIGVYQAWLKPLPADLSLKGEVYQVSGSNVEFVYDVTGMKAGQRVSQQRIFDRVLGMIHQAQDFVLVDFFLFNEYLGKNSTRHRRLCQELSSALLESKRNHPNIHMVVIIDPINEAYGGPVPESFRALRAAGIPVVLTDLRILRDSNPIYSSFWRMFFQWSGTSPAGRLPHPFSRDASGVSIRSWLSLMNFKANHRKLIVTDAPTPAGGRQMECLVTSANPHDGSSAHNNVALWARSGVWRDLVRGEQAVLAFSGQDIDLFSWLPSYASVGKTNDNNAPLGPTAQVQVLTESKIRRSLLEVIEGVGRGDTIDIGMFYVSERSIIKALLNAAQRGANIRVLLDPNLDAFGYQKNGIPNRPVAAELVKRSEGKINVRWYKTHGEQFHSKMVLVKQETKATLFAGSANLTRRNLADLNLETDIVMTAARGFPAIQAAEGYFERVWANRDLDCSVSYETYSETSSLKYWIYRFQEWSGATTF